MKKEEILKFMNKNPEFFLATCEGNEPRVRGIRIYQADSEGIFFNTRKDKSLCKQLIKNPSIEMCFYDGDCTQVRIRGKAKLNEDPQYIERMCRKSPEMESVITQGKLVTYQVTDARVKVWEMDGDYIPRIMSNFETDSIWMAMYMGVEGKVEK